MQRNLRPPVLTSIKCIGLRHFGHAGGGEFLGMGMLPLHQAGAQHSLSPITAETWAVMNRLCALRIPNSESIPHGKT
jgi:hypothetical protein